MSIQESIIPVSVDYTSKDYSSIREELITRIQSRVPEWTASDPADFGVALVEAFAYLGDMISYYIDRAANESFITTATQRSSVLNIASTYGYTVSGYRQASVGLVFTNSSATTITLPAGTVVSGDVVDSQGTVKTYYFTLDSETTIVGDSSSSAISASEGRSVTLISDNATVDGELIGVSTGLPTMTFELGETPVVDGSIEIYVQDGDIFSKWTEYKHLIDANSYDLAFSVSTTDNDIVVVTFGDGVSGSIPTLYSEIRAKYIVGGGTAGNVTSETLTNINYIPGKSEIEVTAIQSVLSVTNPEIAVGGSDPESTEQIRAAAPLALRAINRAVTLQDYADLALGAGAGKAQAKADVWTSVTVYIAPKRTVDDSDPAPGLDGMGDPTLEFTTLQADVQTKLNAAALLGTTVTIQPPSYVDIVITVQYTKLPQYTTSEVEASLKTTLVTKFGYNGMFFADTLAPEDIQYELAQTRGVKIARVTALHRVGDTGLNTLVGDADEIFHVTEENISVGPIV